MSWEAVEADIIALMRQSSALRTELKTCQERAKQEKKALLLEMASVLDAFDRVFANIGDKDKDADKPARIWVGNFRSVHRLLDSTLKQAGVIRIESSGKAIPGLHTVVETVANPDLENDTIVEELETGYRWGEEVLRKASVKVVRN
jgi:molecular chaperone GrpE